jgi:NodT family efflux transporter outer membrane factor (OMF) lipoprotein
MLVLSVNKARKASRAALMVATSGAVLAACAVGPNYHRPPLETPPAFKEVQGWTPARPADSLDRGDWWTMFNDPVLNDLEKKLVISNQNIAAAAAAYREARDLVAEQRAALFPTVDLTGSGTRAKAPGGSPANSYQVQLGASWAPDLWGAVRRGIEGAKAGAQASDALLANARLSAQSELAADYIQLRLADAEKRILTETVEAYTRTLKITQNQYAVGNAAKSDVLQAQSTLNSAQASLIDLDTQRAQSEHAIAVLIGRPPAEVSIAAIPDWAPTPPPTPVEAPSVLLQRRPDVADAERLAAQASAQIGVQVAAYFPNVTLSGAGGSAANTLANLFKSATTSWSYGANVAQTVFNAGLTHARVRAARDAYDQSVAQYRQTTLTAFEQVEDDLAAARVLQTEEAPRRQAYDAADQAQKILLNEYRAGQVAYTSVVVAQATALSARQTLLILQAQRMTTAVSLIEALGGGWDGKTKP